ncbi:hypothetical protein FRC02_001822 [Tulasnella sp. 418]|nr:hypothetical protein FRC02_001822 [Tulasnella sp. 418]
MDSQLGTRKEVDRQKTSPFLLRTFVKVNGFHRIGLFEDNELPIADEHQIYTWRDATLKELVTYLRSLPPSTLTLTLRHPAAKYSFRLVFADATSRGRIASKELGTVHAKDVINPSLLSQDLDDTPQQSMDLDTSKADGDRTLEELRVVPGDWLTVAVYVPSRAAGLNIAGAAATTPTEAPSRGSGLSIRGGANGFGRGLGRGADSGWGRGQQSSPVDAPGGRWGRGGGEVGGGGHWRGRGQPPSAAGRGGAGRDLGSRRDPPRERRPSPTGRDRDRERERSRSRSRSPKRRPSPSYSRSRSPRRGPD